MINVLLKIVFLLLISLSYSCTAIYSTANSVGSSVASLFKSPAKIENKITNPKIDSARLSVLWVGHSTMLIQIDNKFILTDPVFTETVAFLSKRLIEPGIDIENLPQIDIALVSHLHPDHLSLGSLDLIEEKISELLISEGGLLYIPNFEFNSSELKWWQSSEINGIKITSTPVLHNGMRYGLDYNWLPKAFASYIIEYNGITVYFAGDTGFDSTTTIFKEISKKFPKIDLAILPIAPIHPREYSNIRHTDPHDAILIAKQINAKHIIPMHYDTFAEAFDTLGEAELLMRQEMLKNNLTDKEVIILKIGEQKVIIPKEN
ncbi:MAG: MBL fold metallo-hydrolase [Bacteroidetes bacterium]|nr:MBL fold metallo-hydrolase [Bacteroidota bacterium]MBU1116880.1 MBL fold metallo-hydrolase [Bacteroidota bacterium]MBU1797442.1 MBL fold metallo-hydrolase [Bacteroidota bacterium]